MRLAEHAKAATQPLPRQHFRDAMPNVTSANAVTADRPLSLLGAALLWSSWSADLDLLHSPCLVIKATPRAAAKPMPPG
jgi:hypothetical protein